eukprot:PLAT3679.2.p1 GENE.PLAT3679.2~~PLAT3679.2.p1  ORF type:complete len:915 (+),score=425.17 PLAT3679.2:196-2745(+)
MTPRSDFSSPQTTPRSIDGDLPPPPPPPAVDDSVAGSEAAAKAAAAFAAPAAASASDTAAASKSPATTPKRKKKKGKKSKKSKKGKVKAERKPRKLKKGRRGLVKRSQSHRLLHDGGAAKRPLRRGASLETLDESATPPERGSLHELPEMGLIPEAEEAAAVGGSMPPSPASSAKHGSSGDDAAASDVMDDDYDDDDGLGPPPPPPPSPPPPSPSPKASKRKGRKKASSSKRTRAKKELPLELLSAASDGNDSEDDEMDNLHIKYSSAPPGMDSRRGSAASSSSSTASSSRRRRLSGSRRPPTHESALVARVDELEAELAIVVGRQVPELKAERQAAIERATELELLLKEVGSRAAELEEELRQARAEGTSSAELEVLRKRLKDSVPASKLKSAELRVHELEMRLRTMERLVGGAAADDGKPIKLSGDGEMVLKLSKLERRLREAEMDRDAVLDKLQTLQADGTVAEMYRLKAVNGHLDKELTAARAREEAASADRQLLQREFSELRVALRVLAAQHTATLKTAEDKRASLAKALARQEEREDARVARRVEEAVARTRKELAAEARERSVSDRVAWERSMAEFKLEAKAKSEAAVARLSDTYSGEMRKLLETVETERAAEREHTEALQRRLLQLQAEADDMHEQLDDYRTTKGAALDVNPPKMQELRRQVSAAWRLAGTAPSEQLAFFSKVMDHALMTDTLADMWARKADSLQAASSINALIARKDVLKARITRIRSGAFGSIADDPEQLREVCEELDALRKRLRAEVVEYEQRFDAFMYKGERYLPVLDAEEAGEADRVPGALLSRVASLSARSPDSPSGRRRASPPPKSINWSRIKRAVDATRAFTR